MCQRNSDPDDFVEPILKYILNFFNVVITLVGIACICAGSWLLYERDKYISTTSGFSSIFELSRDLGALTISIGILMFFFGIFAMVAVTRENITLLKVYMGFLITILIASTISGVIFLIFSGKIKEYVENLLQTDYITYYYDDADIKTFMDSLQSEFQCCGINNYSDWSINAYFNCNQTLSTLRCFVPGSCCKNYTDTTNSLCSGNVLDSSTTTLSNIYTDGCSYIIEKVKNIGVYALSGLLVSLTVLQIIGIILVVFLLRDIEKDRDHYNRIHIQDLEEKRKQDENFQTSSSIDKTPLINE